MNADAMNEPRSEAIRSKHRLTHRALVKTAVTVLALGTLMMTNAQTAGATPAGPGAPPPSATVGEFTSNSSQPLNGPDLAFAQAKQQLAQGALSTSALDAAAVMGLPTRSLRPLAAAATSKNLPVPYMAQINSSWCGPATVAMIASYLGVGWSGTATAQQNAAASLLGTTMADGTAFYGADNVPSFPYSNWYPAADTLDYRIYQATTQTWYSAAPVSGTPTSAENSQYVANLPFDIDHSHPIALNQYSVPNYQFSYQPNGTWYHWLVARGYSGSGTSTIVNDPGWSAGSNATVPSTSGAHSVTYAIGGRGYIW